MEQIYIELTNNSENVVVNVNVNKQINAQNASTHIKYYQNTLRNMLGLNVIGSEFKVKDDKNFLVYTIANDDEMPTAFELQYLISGDHF